MVADKTMLPKEIPQARIMVFQYASQWFGEGAVSQTIEAVAKKLIMELKDKRSEECENRPIIFIGHSLGGILIEKAVIRAKVEGAPFLKVFNAIAGCTFLGCPFTGSPSQMKAAFASNLLSLANMGRFTPFLKLLEEDNPQLLGMRDEFLNIVEQTKMLTCNFYELKETNINKFSTASAWLSWTAVSQLVAPEATATFPGKTNLALNTDHSGLNKFDSPNNGHWIAVKNRIKEMANEAQKAIKARQNALSPKVDEATYDRMMKALHVNMDEPEQDLNQILDAKGDSMVATAEMTLGVAEVTNFLEDPAPGAIMLTLHPGMDKGMRAVAIYQRIMKNIKAPGAVDMAPGKMCYFFCDNTQRKNNALSMVKAFCHQLVLGSKRLAEHLPGDHKASDKRLAYDSLDTLADPFISMTRDQGIGTVYIIIDAIDQLEENSRKDFFKTVMQETLFASTEDPPKWKVKVKYIFIGLARADIMDTMHKVQNGIILSPEQLGTEAQLLDSLKVMVRHKVTDLAKRMKYRKALLFSLRTEILQRSEGNATWVDLACGEIESVSPKPVDVRSFVEHLKQGLKQLYDQIQYRVLKSGGKNMEYTKEILRTMMIVLQHPTPQELAILADLPEEIRHDEDEIAEYIKGCGSFLKLGASLEYDDDGNYKEIKRVQFIDDSAREYLNEHAADTLGLTSKLHVQHGIIALRCLSYLQGEDAPDMNVEDEDPLNNDDGDESHHGEDDENKSVHSNDDDINDEDQKTKSVAGPLDTSPEDEAKISAVVEDVEYPAMFWLDHAKLATDDVVEDFDLDDRLDFWGDDHVSSDDARAKARTWWPRLKQLEKEHATLHKLTPVHLAAFFNFVPLLDELLRDEDKRKERLAARDSFGRQPLYWAAHEGNIDCVKMMLERGADPDARSHGSPTGVTALHGAAYHGDVEVVKVIVEALEKIDPKPPTSPLDVQNEILGTPLCCAAYNVNGEIVKYLLEKGASLEAPHDYAMGNAVGAAVWIANDENVIKPLLDAGSSINVPYCDGDWPLLAPVVNNNPDVIEMMLEEKHHANKESRQMALIRACSEGHLEVFLRMIGDRGEGKPKAPTYIVDLEHKEALVGAAQQGQTGIIETYPKEFFSQEILDACLYMAVDMEQEDTVKALLKLGASPNAEGEEFGNALQASAFDGTADITRLLIEAGADVNKQGAGYGYAIQAAAVSGSVNIMEQLVKAGANVNAGPDGFYGNALYAAAITNDFDAAKFLVEHGADVNANCDKYTTALLAAVQSSDFKIMEYLLEKGADVNARCTGEEHAMGATPLILSTFTMSAESAKHLIEKGADINAVDDEGMTALVCAAWCPDSDMVKMLLEHGGSDVNHHSWKRGTALQAAAAKGSEDCCEVLLEHGANVNGAPKSAVAPPIWLAAKEGDLECFQILMEKGADLHFREQEKEVGSLLAAAIIGGDKEIVDTLLNNHIPIETPLGEHGTALQLAILHSTWDDDDTRTQLMRSFFDRDEKPDVNQIGGKYHTALQVACYRGNQNVVDLVLQHDPDISTTGGFYNTALAAAAAENDINTIDKLEEHYGDRITQEMKDEALHYALHYEKHCSMEKLLAMGADILSVGRWGTVLECNAKGLPDEDKNSDDPQAGEEEEDEEEEESDPSKYWDEPVGKILLVPGWKEEVKEDGPGKDAREEWKDERKEILETWIKKAKKERGIVDSEPESKEEAVPPMPPVPPMPAQFIHEMDGTAKDRSMDNTPLDLSGSPAPSVRTNRWSISRKPLSPSASFTSRSIPQNSYPETIVHQPLFSGNGPHVQDQAFNIPSHGDHPPSQLTSSPELQFSDGLETARGYNAAAAPPRPPYTPHDSSYGQPQTHASPSATSPPPALMPGGGIQRITRRPVGGGRAVSSACVSSVLSPPVPAPYGLPAVAPHSQPAIRPYSPPQILPYTPPVDQQTPQFGNHPQQVQQRKGSESSQGYSAYNRSNFDQHSYPAYAPPQPPKLEAYQTSSPPQEYQGYNPSVVSEGYQAQRQNMYGAPPQMVTGGGEGYQRQSMYGNPTPQNSWPQAQPVHSQASQEENTYRRDSSPAASFGAAFNHGGIATAGGVGAVGGAAAGYGVASQIQEDEPVQAYEPDDKFVPTPPTQNYNHAMRETTPEPGAQRRYSWQAEDDDQNQSEQIGVPEDDDEPEAEDDANEVDGQDAEETPAPTYGGNAYDGDGYDSDNYY